MDFNFQRSVVVANIYGVEYRINRPTLSIQEQYQRAIEGKTEKEISDLTIDLLDKLGLPKEVTAEMELEHVIELFSAVLQAKKK